MTAGTTVKILFDLLIASNSFVDYQTESFELAVCYVSVLFSLASSRRRRPGPLGAD
jgi:hypothetical protein